MLFLPKQRYLNHLHLRFTLLTGGLMNSGSLTKMSIREENEMLKWNHYRMWMLPTLLRGAQVLSSDLQGGSGLSVLIFDHSAHSPLSHAFLSGLLLLQSSQIALPTACSGLPFLLQLFTVQQAPLIPLVKTVLCLQGPLSTLVYFHIIFHILPNNIT